MSRNRAILIAGPTASGKSALALAIAEARGPAVIVNADSMQVYTDLSVLTARPDAADEARAPHRLFGNVDGAEAYSVARYVEDAGRELEAARQAGLLPIVVGGTGLYFKALLEGLSPIPAIDPAVRARLRAEAAEMGALTMHEQLEAIDPEMAARLVPTDTQRITRALEVIESTGRSLADWQRVPGTPVLDPAATVRLVLAPPRDILTRRCDDRFDQMMALGALDEVRRLAARNLSPELPVMRALGVPPLLAHLRGEATLSDACAAAKTETRQFAKRQLTWLRRHMIAWNRFNWHEMKRNMVSSISNIDFTR